MLQLGKREYCYAKELTDKGYQHPCGYYVFHYFVIVVISFGGLFVMTL